MEQLTDKEKELVLLGLIFVGKHDHYSYRRYDAYKLRKKFAEEWNMEQFVTLTYGTV